MSHTNYFAPASVEEVVLHTFRLGRSQRIATYTLPGFDELVQTLPFEDYYVREMFGLPELYRGVREFSSPNSITEVRKAMSAGADSLKDSRTTARMHEALLQNKLLFVDEEGQIYAAGNKGESKSAYQGLREYQ